MPGESCRDAGLSAEQELNRIFKSIIDQLVQEMSNRFSRLQDLENKFGFLLEMKFEETNDILLEKCHKFSEFYSGDVDGVELFNEIQDYVMLAKTREPIETPADAIELLKFIICYGNDVFPNLSISLQILLTIAVSIATCERSFSKLKLILNYLRTTMSQNRTSDLALLSIERDMFNSIDFDDVIDQFAEDKSRKVDLK